MKKVLAAMVGLLLGVAAAEQPLVSGSPIDCAKLAFRPDVWKKLGPSTQMTPWAGEYLVFLTTNKHLDGAVMARFVARLDAGWKLYAELTGAKPRPFKQLDGKATIAAVPRGELTCGLGCGYIGVTGIEVCGFYNHDYPLIAAQTNAFPHYYFYEMGRNYYTFGDRHALFLTGYAVFMRYVCMDTLGCDDPDSATRRTIEEAEALYAKTDMDFLCAFTAVCGLGEKEPRLKRPDGKPLQPSDQPVLYASAMLKLWREYGGNAWLKKFYAELAKCPPFKGQDREVALRQSLNWLVAASCAAQQDLSGVFADRWRLPLNHATREALAQVKWRDPATDAVAVLAQLPKNVGVPAKETNK
ncbi:MAG: calcium-binding protein [Kiritimatiellaeota bacterium]|nr:calcium-binding protein [Kiritimatiellota bacterium]